MGVEGGDISMAVIPGSDLPASVEALPNPRGAMVRTAEAALLEAQRGLTAQADVSASFALAAVAFCQAGWYAAQCFADTLVLAAPLRYMISEPRSRGAIYVNSLAPRAFLITIASLAHTSRTPRTRSKSRMRTWR
jgi:hypothetical protein